MDFPPSAQTTRAFWPPKPLWLILGVTLAASLQLWCMTSLYSVNILFSDQWDLYDAFMNDAGWWEVFRWQHGPHRQGLAFLITEAVLRASGWNTRYESFLACLTLIAAAPLAVWLKWRLSGNLKYTDAAIPLMILTPLQWGVLFVVPNLSHGAFPLLLAVCYALSWSVSRPMLRMGLVLLCNVLLIYSGFGLFMGGVTIILLGMDTLRVLRGRARGELFLNLTGLAVAAVCLAGFFVDYRFMPAVSDFRFPAPNWHLYPVYMALMVGKFFGAAGTGIVPSIAGSVALLGMIGIAVRNLLILVRSPEEDQRSFSRIVLALIAYTLAFALFSAIGRISMGLGRAQCSNYLPYVATGVLGVFLDSCGWPLKWGRAFRVAVLCCLGLITVAAWPYSHKELARYRIGKSAWAMIYKRTHDVALTNRLAKFEIYPPSGAARIKRKLDYLERRGLNLFHDLKP